MTNEQEQFLIKFANDIAAYQKDLPPDLAQALNDHFWEWYEPIGTAISKQTASLSTDNAPC
jgi:hypothetical protein